MGRAPCCENDGLKKGPWTPEEDLKLTQYVHKHGAGNWRALPKNAGLRRCGKSCRLRWTNYLRPDIKRGRFSFEEEETIIQLHSSLGNKWSAIAARLPGRTDNEIKNYWNTHIRRRLLKMGIDPVTHTPRLDLINLSSIIGSSLCNNQLLNMSNLLATQQLFNPELFKLASTILAIQQNPLQYQQQFMQTNAQGFSSGLENFSSLLSQENQKPSSLNEGYVSQTTNTENLPALEDSSFKYLNNCGDDFGFNSVLSSPVSSTPTPLNPSSILINSGAEEERDQSYCSNLLRFEIPEGFDINEFL